MESHLYSCNEGISKHDKNPRSQMKNDLSTCIEISSFYIEIVS